MVLYSALGHKTLSRTISTRGPDQVDWSAGHKLFNRSSWQGDPLSPPFNCNFVWGKRYLQSSMLLPLYNEADTPPRAIPVQLKDLPKFKRPKKMHPRSIGMNIKELTKKYNSSTCLIVQLRYLRNELNLLGQKEKKLIAVVDGSYINKTCLNHGLENSTIVGRTRKNARLFLKSKRREIRYKTIEEVYWKWGTRKKPLKLIIIAPTPYRLRKNGKLNYRDAPIF